MKISDLSNLTIPNCCGDQSFTATVGDPVILRCYSCGKALVSLSWDEYLAIAQEWADFQLGAESAKD